MNTRRFFSTAAVILCCAAPAAAQGVKLEFHDGRVNLSAQNVPLRTILTEWARLGGTTIGNGDRVPGGLVTLEFNGVPERQVLDTLLRSASGYVAGPRQEGQRGASSFASIMILPTSSAPRPAPAVPQPVAQPNNPQFLFRGPVPRPVPQQVTPPPDSDDEPAGDVPPEEDINETPPPNQRGPRGFTPPRGNNRGPVQEQPAPAPTPAPGVPSGGSVGSSQPGVISPVPQPAQQPRSQVDPEP